MNRFTSTMNDIIITTDMDMAVVIVVSVDMDIIDMDRS